MTQNDQQRLGKTLWRIADERRKIHYVIKPEHLWSSIANLARTQSGELLDTLQVFSDQRFLFQER